jgi:hypothetical protein
VDRVDLIRVVRGDIPAKHRQRNRIGVVDDRALFRFRRRADIDFVHRFDPAERFDAATKLGTLRRSEFRFKPEVDGVDEHDERFWVLGFGFWVGNLKPANA